MSWWWCFRWQMVVVAAVFMVFLTNPGRSQPQTNVLTQSCSLVNVTNTQNFSINLRDTFRDVRRQLSDPNTYFATSNLTRNSEPVYVMIQCRNYMSKSDCLRCFDFAARSIRSCAASNGGRLALEGCFLRYESNWFYDQYGKLPEVSPGVCGNSTSSRQSVFETSVDGLLTNLSIATPKINGFYAAVKTSIVGTNTTTAYAIAQCAETATPNGCKSCLQLAYDNIRSCATDFSDGMAVLLGCFMRFSATAFFRNNQTTDITPFLRRGRSSNKGAIIGGIGGLFLLLIGVLLWYSRSKRTTQGDSLYGVTKLQGSKDYSYSDLRKGTENFTEENKLGEGGFGDVYKNLLRLLGWSSEGPNLFPVLEYMPNGSLDKFLWGEKKGLLNWKSRYDIILGIARGLAHLHKEFHFRIVHRDIKSSNILLDEDFKPKIADFGLARFHPEDKTHITTQFAGTLGYTAPEYLLYGALSDKVDTFSFGIVILEIISGRKCTYRNFGGPSTDCLLEHAWKLYETQKLMMLVDETMDVIPDEEKRLMKIIQIALLCTQSPVSKRPTMLEVVSMHTNDPSFGEKQLFRSNFTDNNRRIHIGS